MLNKLTTIILLPVAEFAYNNSVHVSTQLSLSQLCILTHYVCCEILFPDLEISSFSPRTANCSTPSQRSVVASQGL